MYSFDSQPAREQEVFQSVHHSVVYEMFWAVNHLQQLISFSRIFQFSYISHFSIDPELVGRRFFYVQIAIDVKISKIPW